ncbi:unnamed protein product [Pylaiella littoralis]
MAASEGKLATKPPKENSLDSFIPTSYLALLEGTLLTNGDLKGSWRFKREDVVQNDFCMVLMGKGIYDGGFNIQVPKANTLTPAVLEIHDKWHSFEWVETTKPSCNVWGQGCNNQFGGFYTIGVHDPRQRRIVIYKVCEEEMRRAREFARAGMQMQTPPLTAPPPVMAGAVVAAAAAAAKAAAAKAAAAQAKAAQAAFATSTARGRGQKRPRAHARSGEIATAAAMLDRNTSTAGGSCSSNSGSIGGGKCPHADARSGDGGGGGGGSGRSDPMREAGSEGGSAGRSGVHEMDCPGANMDEDMDPGTIYKNMDEELHGVGSPRVRMNKRVHAMDCPGANMDEDMDEDMGEDMDEEHLDVDGLGTNTIHKGTRKPVPVPIRIPADMLQVSSLPGFSGRFDDGSLTFADASVDELADLSILGARLQREKLKIQEDAKAQRQPFEKQKEEYQSKLIKARGNETMMLRAVQELREQMVDDERSLESATQRVMSYEAEEQHALLLWNEKWETQVAPFIAQCEQGVRKKAEELEKKALQAEKEKMELKRELERLDSVKQIGDVFPPNLSI